MTMRSALVLLGLTTLLLAGCPGPPASPGGSGRGKGAKTEFVIHQPDAEHKDDKVIVWKEPGRKNRAFLLAPGTVVKIRKTVDGSRYSQDHDIYQIEEPGTGRTGWVPAKWVKERKKR